MTSTSPETRPVPLVVIGGTIVHRASAVRQITGPRPIQHANTSRAEAAIRAAAYRDRHLLDRVIRGAAAVIVVVEVVKTGVPWWLLLRFADGLIVASAMTGR